MTTLLLLMAAQFMLLTVVGAAVVGVIPSRQRALLLPALPALGAALISVVLSSTTWFWSARVGAWAVLLTVVVLAAIAYRARSALGTKPWQLPRRAVAVAVATMLLSLAGVVTALLPAIWLDDHRPVPSVASQDLFYYAAESAWLQDHPILPTPQVLSTPGELTVSPAFGPIVSSLDVSLRIGQPLVHATLDAVMGTDAADSLMAMSALWLLLLGPCAFVAARLLGASTLIGFAAALLTTTAATVLSQFYAGNVDALLGMSLALLAISTVVSAAERRISPWPAAVVVAGLVGVYTEYALFVAPAVLGVLVARRWADVATRLRALVVVGVLAVVIAPGAWLRGLGTMRISRGAAEGGTWPSPYYSDGLLVGAERALGLAPANGSGTGWLTWVVGMVIVAGLLCAVAFHRHRWSWLLVLAVTVPYLVHLTMTRQGYTQMRAVQLATPVLILVAVVGVGAAWTAVARRRGARSTDGPRSAHRAWIVRSVAATTACLLAASNLHSAAAQLDRPMVEARHVDRTYEEAAEWVEEHGSAEGRDVTVLSADMASHMWLAYELRDEPLVVYPALRPDYLRVPTFWDGDVDRLALVGPGSYYAGPRKAVLERNQRFRMIDLSTPNAVVATPMDLPAWSAMAGVDNSMDGPDGGAILLATRSGAPTDVALELRTATGANGPVSIRIGDVTVAEATVGAQPTSVPIHLDGSAATMLHVDLGADGAASGERFILSGVTRAS